MTGQVSDFIGITQIIDEHFKALKLGLCRICFVEIPNQNNTYRAGIESLYMRAADIDLPAFVNHSIGSDQEMVSNISETASIHVQFLDFSRADVLNRRVMYDNSIQDSAQII